MTELRKVAVILAGGTGTRVGHSIPKQLIKIADKTIIEHAIAAFDTAPSIDEIVVMMTPGHLEPVRAIVKAGRYKKVTQILEGGDSRTDSTRRALEALGAEECHVLLHDGARPAVSQSVIARVVDGLATHDAVGPAVASTDTTVLVESGVMVDVMPRDRLQRMQTPQGFRLSIIRTATELALADEQTEVTDDCTAVLRHMPGIDVQVVAGDPDNIKVTTRADLDAAERLLTH